MLLDHGYSDDLYKWVDQFFSFFYYHTPFLFC